MADESSECLARQRGKGESERMVEGDKNGREARSKNQIYRKEIDMGHQRRQRARVANNKQQQAKKKASPERSKEKGYHFVPLFAIPACA